MIGYILFETVLERASAKRKHYLLQLFDFGRTDFLSKFLILICGYILTNLHNWRIPSTMEAKNLVSILVAYVVMHNSTDILEQKPGVQKSQIFIIIITTIFFIA
jgi:hypothetical protein